MSAPTALVIKNDSSNLLELSHLTQWIGILFGTSAADLARLQTAAVSQEEKLSSSQAEFGQLPKVIDFSLLNKTSFAVLRVADTLCSLESSGCKQTSEEELSIPPPRVGIRLKIICSHSWM